MTTTTSVRGLLSTGTPFQGDPHAAAVPRLALLAILLAVISILFALRATLHSLGIINFPGIQTQPFDHTVTVIAVCGSIAMFVLTRIERIPAETVLDWGLAFQVFGGLCISLLEQAVVHTGVYVSFVCLWILSFPILPVSLRRANIAAWTTALMGPLAMMIHVVIGRRAPPTQSLEWLTFLPNILATLIASVTARVIYGLGQKVDREKKVGAYELQEMLGHGGMGEVWRATHHSLIRPAAIKLLRRELTATLTPQEREVVNLRFQREVQATALLTSPHTVAVFDFGYSAEGNMYYVMELLTGLDAESVVRRYGPLPAERVVYLVSQACDSLAEAHTRNLIHRDVKPANLHLCAVGLEVDFIKLLDFGLVRDEGSDLQLTNEGSVSGTPAYLAPESSTQRAFDARSDIYGLGCVMYFLLTGQLVFEGQTAAAVIAAHIRDRPVPPSRRTNLPISPELDALVMRCLSKNPDDRPQSADELKRLLAELPLETPWTQDRAHAWWLVHLPELVEQATRACGPDSNVAASVERNVSEHVAGAALDRRSAELHAADRR
jgi:serine/threonine protein kinase